MSPAKHVVAGFSPRSAEASCARTQQASRARTLCVNAEPQEDGQDCQ
jgi:hypothetical protein